MTSTKIEFVPTAAGDPIPEALARYIAALADEDADAAAGAFSGDALYAVPPRSVTSTLDVLPLLGGGDRSDGGETTPRVETVGRVAIAGRSKAREGDIALIKHHLGPKRRAGTTLTPRAVADRDALRIADANEAYGAADTLPGTFNRHRETCLG